MDIYIIFMIHGSHTFWNFKNTSTIVKNLTYFRYAAY